MAFPQVADTASSCDTVANFTFDLPANIEEGDLLMVFVSVDDASPSINWLGWTEIVDIPLAFECELKVAWKRATGLEGATHTVAGLATDATSHICWRITGADDPTIRPPEASTGATGTSVSPNPDSLTPDGGAEDYLWIAVQANDENKTTSAFPYADNNESNQCPGGVGPCNLGVCSDEINASSEDPGVFTISGSDGWCACTVAVYPYVDRPVPTIMDSEDSEEAVATATHTVSVPASTLEGDLLLILFAIESNTITVTDWDDFTEIFTDTNGADLGFFVAYKYALGSEGGTATIVTSGAIESLHMCYRISGKGNDDAIPLVPEVSTGATGSSVNPNSDSLTPSGGSKEYLWLSIVARSDLFLGVPTVYPYADNNDNVQGSGLLTLTMCSDEIEAATEDPGAYTFTAPAALWIASTIAIVFNFGYPRVVGTAYSNVNNGTDHVVDLPAGIVAGDLLIIFLSFRVDVTITDWDGFTELYSDLGSTPLVEGFIAYKKATGSEGADVTIVTSVSERSAHIAHLIRGHEDPDVQAPEVSTGVGGTSNSPDPDSLTPTGGAKNYLWFAIENNADSTPVAQNFPAYYNHPWKIQYVSTGFGVKSHVAVGARQLYAVSDDPGVFTLNASREWLACTIVVHPAAEAAVSGLQINISDAWKDVEGIQINIGDAWKEVAGMQINIGDAWKTIF